MKRKIIAVSKVNHYVSRLLEEDYILSDLWISGEISGCKYHHSGHIYFTLKDEGASINSVMFARDVAALSFRLEEGLKVVVRARITLYEKTGAYQAYVSEVEKQGIGALYEKFERLKKQLEAEGLFLPEYKKEVPMHPKKVGVITSATGAAIKDIVQVAKRRNPSIPIYIYPAHVQGTYAKDEIIQQIERANEQGIVDVLIVGRGGGSLEDLWTFNEEEVARAIFASHIPIISAVGHEVDFTIADFVSDKRAATPSQAAELAIPSGEEYEEALRRYYQTLQYIAKSNIAVANNQLSSLLSRPVYQHKSKRYQEYMLLVDQLASTMQRGYANKVEKYQTRLVDHINQLEALSPLHTLKRGYSLVTGKKQQVIRSVKDVHVADVLEVTVTDGSFAVQVIEERE